MIDPKYNELHNVRTMKYPDRYQACHCKSTQLYNRCCEAKDTVKK